MSLELDFEGWWQCRFATDPDPSDEPHGVSGPTFTVPGEPPFDRLVRFQDPVCPRYPHADGVGVNVTAVRVGGVPAPAAHPLQGARVDLLDGPQFNQRNLVLVDAPFQLLLDPFHLQIAGGGVTLSRAALWDVTRPGLTVDDVFLEPDLLKPRMNAIAIQSAEVAEATGVMDYAATRAQRAANLRRLAAEEPDPVTRAGYERRIAAFDADEHLTGARLAGEQFMGMQATWSFPLNGTPRVEDSAGALGGTAGTSQPWPVQFWLGGYDVDTLLGYARGTLTLPFLAAS